MPIVTARGLLSLLAAAALAACADTAPPTASRTAVISPAPRSSRDKAIGWSSPSSLGATVNASGFDTRTGSMSTDGLSLYFHSNRPGGKGANDLWVTHRERTDAPWQTPQNLATLNTAGPETNARISPDGHDLWFVALGVCGGRDIVVSHREDVTSDLAWEAPVNLGCTLNSSSDDASPVFVPHEPGGAALLYFASTRPGGPGGNDFYVSTRARGGAWQAAELVAELSTPYDDNKLAISRDGRTVLFSSNRPGGGSDAAGYNIWESTRQTRHDPWSVAWVAVESAGLPVLSPDDRELFMARPQAFPYVNNDLSVSTRERP